MSKKKDGVRVSFIGENANGVTGSMILVEYKDTKILLECGAFQGGTVLECYQKNYEAFKEFKAREINYCFILHGHQDHGNLIPRLYAKGFRGKIIATHTTATIMHPMLLDSAYIHKKDAEYLTQKKKFEYQPLYTEYDVDSVIGYVYEYGYDEVYKLDENFSFRFIKNSHIIGAAQLELFIKDDSGHKKKIFYSSDIGNPVLHKPFVDEMEYCNTANLAIFESTYGNAARSIGKKDREKDLEKIKSIVRETILENKGCVLVPSFSLDRSQMMLYLFYKLFYDDEEFKDIKIIVDSPLTKTITDIYKKEGILTEENRELINEITEWDNVRFITDKDESKACIEDGTPKIVISASGFLEKGRSRHYLKRYISGSKNAILFVGYATPTSLAGKIKNNTERQTITIDGKAYRMRCKIVCLNSLSSHMQKDQLVEYMNKLNCEKIVLVHGDKDAKLELKETAEEVLRKNNKTTKVICSQKGLVAHL